MIQILETITTAKLNSFEMRALNNLLQKLKPGTLEIRQRHFTAADWENLIQIRDAVQNHMNGLK